MVVSPLAGGAQEGLPETHEPLVRWPDWLLTAGFIALFLVQLAHHAMWRDELNVFGIARASPSIASLFWHVHYEGHPWLWYFLVWIVSRFTADPVAMKVLEAGIVIATYALIGIGSPFSRLEKTLLFLNYFISFEYTVIARMYSVLLLLALLYARERSLHPERTLRLGLLLGLMACTDVMGMILSAGLAVEYATHLFLHRRFRLPWKPHYVWGALLYACLALFAVWSARTSSDISWRTTGHVFAYAHDLRHLTNALLSYTVLPYFPVAFGHYADTFWNPFPERKRLFFAICFLVLLFVYRRIFQRFPALMISLCMVLLAASAFGHLIYMGSMRHYGITFLAFVAALWILRSQSRKLPALALGLLVMGALAGAYVAFAQWQRPFSNLEAAASWLTANGLKDAPFTGTPDTSIAQFAIVLNRPVYMLECACTDTFLFFSKRRDNFKESQTADRLLGASRYYGGHPLVFADVLPLTQVEEQAIRDQGLTSEKIAQFTGAIAERENFYLYRIIPSRGLN